MSNCLMGEKYGRKNNRNKHACWWAFMGVYKSRGKNSSFVEVKVILVHCLMILLLSIIIIVLVELF